MKKIDRTSLEQILQKISTNFDETYRSVLFSSGCLEILEDFLKSKNPSNLQEFGGYCATQGMPYLELSFVIEDLFTQLHVELDDFLDHLAHGYLQVKLQNDAKHFQVELQKVFIYSVNAERDIINAHVRWLLEFINSIIKDTQLPQMDETQCVLGSWIESNSEEFDTKEIRAKHHSLHTLAQHAYRSYKQGNFHRFLLLHIDVIYYATIIRQDILQHFTKEELVSISIDALTHLPNRFALLSDTQGLDTDTSLFLFNIKDFAKINLLFGQEIGDKVLKSVAHLLLECKECSKVYRIYGDEFGVLLKSKNAYESIQKLITLLESTPHPKNTNLVNIALYGAYAKVSEHLLEKVEFGVMHGKQNSNKITNVDTITHQEMLEYAKNLELSQRLQLAFADNRIYPHYQPILNIDTGKIEKYEVLLRVEDLDGQIMNPSEFLDVLKNMSIYPEVTKMVVLEAFEKFKDETYDFSVNLSFRDIINEHTSDMIENVIKNNQHIAKRLTFELLEYEAVLNFARVSQFFAKIKNYEVKVALDDFGAGYSNFMDIFKLEIDFIKIDGSIVQDILEDKKSQVLIKSIQNIADEIGAKTIAEYVSSTKIFEAVKLIGVNYAQGYFIGEPKADL